VVAEEGVMTPVVADEDVRKLELAGAFAKPSMSWCF